MISWGGSKKTVFQTKRIWCICLKQGKVTLLFKKHQKAFFHPKCYICFLLSLSISAAGFNKVSTCLPDNSFLLPSHIWMTACFSISHAQSPPSALWSRCQETNLLVFIKHDSKRRRGQFSEAQGYNEVVQMLQTSIQDTIQFSGRRT